jgi:enolase
MARIMAIHGIEMVGSCGNPTVIAKVLFDGSEAADQAAVDRKVIELEDTPDQTRLGGNAIRSIWPTVAVMQAIEKAGSVAGKELGDLAIRRMRAARNASIP